MKEELLKFHNDPLRENLRKDVRSMGEFPRATLRELCTDIASHVAMATLDPESGADATLDTQLLVHELAKMFEPRGTEAKGNQIASLIVTKVMESLENAIKWLSACRAANKKETAAITASQYTADELRLVILSASNSQDLSLWMRNTEQWLTTARVRLQAIAPWHVERAFKTAVKAADEAGLAELVSIALLLRSIHFSKIVLETTRGIYAAREAQLRLRLGLKPDAPIPERHLGAGTRMLEISETQFKAFLEGQRIDWK